MRWLILLALVACGSKPKPVPPPAEREVTSVADIAGDWVADDEMSFSYALAIQPDGTVVGHVDRGKLAACERAGKLSPPQGKTFALATTKDTCAQPGAGTLEVASFTGDVLTIVVTIPGAPPERRTYRRRPS